MAKWDLNQDDKFDSDSESESVHQPSPEPEEPEVEVPKALFHHDWNAHQEDGERIDWSSQSPPAGPSQPTAAQPQRSASHLTSPAPKKKIIRGNFGPANAPLPAHAKRPFDTAAKKIPSKSKKAVRSRPAVSDDEEDSAGAGSDDDEDEQPAPINKKRKRAATNSAAPASASGSSAAEASQPGPRRHRSPSITFTDEDDENEKSPTPPSKSGNSKKERKFFSEEEDAAILEGLEEFGTKTNRWARILRRHRRLFYANGRSSTDLKDRARNIRAQRDRAGKEELDWYAGVAKVSGGAQVAKMMEEETAREARAAKAKKKRPKLVSKGVQTGSTESGSESDAD